MKYLRIFLLNFQLASESRGRSLIWLLVPLINVFVLFTYWNWAIGTNKANAPGWNISELAAYYIFLLIASALLVSHIEEDVSDKDIKQGRLANYISKPFSYYWLKFLEEIPYRILQGFFGILILIILLLLFPDLIKITLSPLEAVLSILILCFAFLISFSFKIILGLFSFWMTDSSGLRNAVEIIFVIFAGFIMPLSLMPDLVSKIANFLPFSYIIYYPVLAFQNKLSIPEIFQVLGIQMFWLVVFYLSYKFVFAKGIKKFTGVGG